MDGYLAFLRRAYSVESVRPLVLLLVFAALCFSVIGGPLAGASTVVAFIVISVALYAAARRKGVVA